MKELEVILSASMFAGSNFDGRSRMILSRERRKRGLPAAKPLGTALR